MKVIINKCYGGFGLSDKAFDWLIKNKGWKVTTFIKGYYKNKNADLVKTDKPKFYGKYWLVKEKDEIRINLDVIEAVEKLGKKANGWCANLEIVEIPDNMKFEITEYDGIETLREEHQSW